MKKILVLLAVMTLCAGLYAQQDSTYIQQKDTIKVNGVTLVDKTSKNGKEYTKAQYMGRLYSISKQDIEKFNTNSAYVVFNLYNNGERKISKIIIK